MLSLFPDYPAVIFRLSLEETYGVRSNKKPSRAMPSETFLIAFFCFTLSTALPESVAGTAEIRNVAVSFPSNI
jgi:hypothetical protein